MQAVILAGGRGTQLHPLTTEIPKSMLPLFDVPVMEHSVRLLAKHGITDIIVTTSHQAGGLVDYFGDGARFGVKMRYSVEAEPRGTAGATRLVQEMIRETFVVFSADAVTDFDLNEALHRHKRASAIATILLSRTDTPTEFGMVATDPDGRVTRFVEKPRSSELFSDSISAGIYIMEPEALSCIPYDRPCSFARDIFPAMLNNGEPVHGRAPTGYWCDVANPVHYREAHFDALRGRLRIELPAAHIAEGIWMAERVEIDASARLTAPVYLGAGARIRAGATIGARTVIGAGALVDEGCSISGSVIGEGSHIGPESQIRNCVIGGGYSTTEGEELRDRTLLSHLHYSLETSTANKAAGRRERANSPAAAPEIKIPAG